MTFATKASLAYLTASISWILLSDRVIFLLSDKLQKKDILLIQSSKGIFFIISTTVLLYLVLKIYSDRKHKYIEEIKRSAEENERLTNILDCVGNMAIVADRNANIIWVNSAFIEFTGYSSEEVLGKTPFILHREKTDPDTVKRIRDKCLRHEFFKEELINYKKNGEHYWVELSFSPLFSDANEFKGYITIHSVITDRKVKDEKIQQQNEVLREMAWLNSHEIRKSVANMLGLLALLSDEETDDKEELVKLLHQSALDLDVALKKIADRSNKIL